MEMALQIIKNPAHSYPGVAGRKNTGCLLRITAPKPRIFWQSVAGKHKSCSVIRSLQNLSGIFSEKVAEYRKT